MPAEVRTFQLAIEAGLPPGVLNVALYYAYQSSIAECDERLAQVLGRLAYHDAPPPEPARTGRGRPRKVLPFDLRIALYSACGVDLTRIDGIDTGTALKVIAEVGPDLSRFKTVKHFCSWLGLCPGTKISGGKVLSGASKRIANRLAQALRIAAIAEARPHPRWALATDVCRLGWARRRPFAPSHTNWRGSSTRC